MAGKLTEEQRQERQEIARRYQTGESLRAIGRAVGKPYNWVHRVLIEDGIPLRSRLEGRHGAETAALSVQLRTISDDRWREMYWGANSGYPSVRELSRRFGCSCGMIRDRLEAAGVKLRTYGEQRHLDIRSGKIVNPGIYNANRAANLPSRVGRKHTVIAKRNMKAAAARHRPTAQPCKWCGSPTKEHYLGISACDLGCFRPYLRMMQESVCALPRPLIADRLRELLREEPYKALPPTYETLEKAGATIGAGEPEIIEVLVEISR